MNRTCFALATLLLGSISAAPSADAPARRTPREALQTFNDLIGSWKGLGTPEGNRADKQTGSWRETIGWEWQFGKDDIFLSMKFDEVKRDGKPSFSRLYQVGATKEGMPLATREGSGGPECIVSGGQGTIKVMYKGQTYFVCCSGCKTAFLDEPEKFIKELQDKQKGK